MPRQSPGTSGPHAVRPGGSVGFPATAFKKRRKTLTCGSYRAHSSRVSATALSFNLDSLDRGTVSGEIMTAATPLNNQLSPDSPPSSVAELNERATRPDDRVRNALRELDGDVLVLGAGGKMGFHLSAMLHRTLAELGKSNRVIAVSRFGSAESKRPFEEYKIPFTACDLTDDQQLLSLPDCPNIFFLAGVKFGAGEDHNLLQKMNVELPSRVARRFPTSRIVALSTGCVYSYVTPESGGSVETDREDPVGAYALSCLGREQAFADSECRCCLIRLNYSVDLRYGVLVDIARRVLAEQPVDVTMGYFNAIWQGDAVAAIVQSIQHVEHPAHRLNLTGQRILSVREVALQFGRRFEKTVRFTGHEAPTAWLNNATLAHRLFGPPQIPEETLIEWVAHWLLQDLPTLDKPTHFEVRDGRF